MEASTARASRPAVAAGSGADAIVQALAEAGTRLMFGVPGGGPNLDVVGAAAAAGLREPPYALRDPSMDERRVLFELEVVKVATFGRP